jgi:hydrocephalus-inducing protein
VHPSPPVLRAGTTTELEVRHRPLVVGASEGTLQLESAELGAYEWCLRLAGTAVNPERSLAFSAPLGGRDARVLRFTHFLGDRVEYRVALRSSAAGGAGRPRASVSGDAADGAGGGGTSFDAPATVVAPPAGPGGWGRSRV